MVTMNDYLVIKTYLSHKNHWKVILKEVLFDCLKYLLPSILFLLLMFTTSVIPLNMYDAKDVAMIVIFCAKEILVEINTNKITNERK